MKKTKKKRARMVEFPLRAIIKELISRGPTAADHRALINVLDHIDRRGFNSDDGDPHILGSTLCGVISAEIPHVARFLRQRDRVRKHNLNQVVTGTGTNLRYSNEED